MTIQTIDAERTQQYSPPAFGGESQMQAELVTESQTGKESNTRSNMLSFGWWLPCLIRGLTAGFFCYLGITWWANIVKLWHINKILDAAIVLLIIVLASESSNYVGKVICKIIKVKEVG